MTQAPPTPARRVRGWDVALTIVLLLAMIAVGLWGAFYGMLALAFMDSCPPAGCDGSPVYLRWLGGFVVGLVALTVSIVLLAIRRRGWWVALLGLVGVFAIWSEFLVATVLYDLGIR